MDVALDSRGGPPLHRPARLGDRLAAHGPRGGGARPHATGVERRGAGPLVSAGLGPATLLYVSLQELATRVAHFNTAKALDDSAGYEIMKRVAADENLHFLFYRDLSTAAMELSPSEMVLAMERVVKDVQHAGYRDLRVPRPHRCDCR